MPVALKDIPQGQLTPDEVEALANGTFDYADRERVSLREAERRWEEQRHYERIARGFIIAKNEKEFLRAMEMYQDRLEPGYGELTFKEKSIEVAKAVNRGAGSVIKMPGVTIKAIGEMAPNRKQIAELEKSPYAIQRFRAKTMKSSIGRGSRFMADVLRRAGNKYIDSINRMTMPESEKSRITREEQPFLSAPFYRTSMAVGESGPSYGTAVVITLSTGNPNAGLFFIGASASSSAYENYRQHGVEPDLALLGAGIEGSIEALTEKIPMDMLIKGTSRPLIIRALKIGTAESFQELFAQLGQNYIAAVIKDVDPENYNTVLQATQQEWSIISQGWQDAMAAGFIMGGAGGIASQGRQNLTSIKGLRTAEQLRAEYGFVPRTTPELLSLVEQVKDRVRTIERRPEEVEPEKAEPVVVPPEAVPIEKVVPEKIPEIGEGEEKPRGTSVSVMAQAIENELISENRLEEIPTYRAMNMKEQAEKALALIEKDVDQAKRVAFYQETSPDPTLYPENVFTALRIYAKQNLDVDLVMDLALNEDAIREHTIMGKRIKSLDTDQDYSDPVRAIKEIVEARTAQKVRKGEDIAVLETKLRELQTELDRTRKANAEFTKRAEQAYGKRNKLVTRTEYDKIIARREKKAAELIRPNIPKGFARGTAYIPNAQDFIDIAKIATFHLEAMGRDFAKWSHQMTRDFGDWIVPFLKDEYDKALKEAEKQGVEIKKSKRLVTKKKRLVTVTEKITGKLKKLDLEKTRRIPIELDEEGRKLQAEYDRAREAYKAAQSAAKIITEKEARAITELSKDVADRRAIMEKSERRESGKPATKTEMEYGTTAMIFLEYVNDLKTQANKRTIRETVKSYLSSPGDFISDLAGSLKAAKASLDNSFHLRQGLPTFLKAITGHIPSMKIWWKTFVKSWKIMWNTLRKRKAMQALSAEMISDPDYELLKQSKVAINVIEEEIPVDWPSRIPLLGMLFKMGENAFVGSSRYMRYQLAKQYLEVWRRNGQELSKKELESIGRLANSQTGRGDIASKSQRPGLVNNLFWSPRNLRAYVDILTVHAFDRNISLFARKQAAVNLLRYISGAAMILALAKWIDDDSVTWDTNSADFGKIRVGNTRFSVGGGMTVLVVLASRLITRKYTSSTTGKTITIDEKKWGALGGKDLIFNFLENKLSPAAQLVLSLIDQKTREGTQLTIPQMIKDALTPLIIQNVIETGSVDDSANVLAALIAEALGVNVQTYSGKKEQKRKRDL